MAENNTKLWQVIENEFVVKVKEAVYGISFIDEDIIRLRLCKSSFKEGETYIVSKLPEPKNFSIKEEGSGVVLKTACVSVNVNVEPVSIEIFNSKDEEILSTPLGLTGEFKGNTSILRLNLKDGEKIYGLGQDPMAHLNQRGYERRMWQEWGAFRRSGNAGIPFYMSSSGYGLLLNSSWPSRFAVGEAAVGLPGPEPDWAPAPWPWDKDSGETDPEKLSIILDGGLMDVFIMCRDSFDDIHKAYVDLTGHAPMFPKWAFGFIQCKNRYRTQAELLHIAREYRKRGIPCDVLVIDWLWFKEFGDLEWFKENWPDPKGMLKELGGMGIKVVKAQHPYIDKNSLKYEEFKEKGYLNRVPDGERPTYDHSNPEARDAWWHEIKRFYEDGIRGYWTDMGELEVHKPGTGSFLGSRERVHNIYSLLWTKGLYEGQRRDYNERVFSLPRTAYAGIQKNSAAMWSGDINSAWEVLKDQVVIGQGVCLSGQQFWTTDIGGFFPTDEMSPELHIRWFQWGAFCPIFRTHGTRPDNEAWSFGEQAEKILDNFIKLRYRLLPYIYSCARKVHEDGTPIMRAMCMDYPDDSEAIAQEGQFMFGPCFLAAPVTEKGARTKKVYLPKGTWYDFWTDRKYEGKQWLEVAAPLDRIPLFVKAGSIIPMGLVMQHTAEKPVIDMELHAYPGVNGSFVLYEDDGKTYDYEQGKYAKTYISMDRDGKVSIDRVDGENSIIPGGRKYTTMVHGLENAVPASPVAIYVDHDLSRNGALKVYALIENNTKSSVSVSACFKAPDGWRHEEKDTQERVFGKFVTLKWVLKPEADALPLIHRGKIIFSLKYDGKSEETEEQVAFGSGFATRFRIAGAFDNSDEQGLERVFDVERDMERPYYNAKTGNIVWKHDTDSDFNCFGYVQFPCPPASPNINKVNKSLGVCYGKCSVWSDEDMDAYIELSADPDVKLWINGQLVYRDSGIVLRQMLKEACTLKKGWNQVLIKCAIASEKPFGGREFGFNFRFVGRNGKVIEKLLYRP